MILKTKNFYLRPFQEGDFDAWCGWVKSSEAIDYLSADFSEEKAKKILDKFIKSWQDFGFTKFAVFTNDGEELVGYAGFALLDDLEINENQLPENEFNKNIRKFADKDNQEFIQLNKYIRENLNQATIKSFDYFDTFYKSKL